jgi:hypothetical protein
MPSITSNQCVRVAGDCHFKERLIAPIGQHDGHCWTADVLPGEFQEVQQEINILALEAKHRTYEYLSIFSQNAVIVEHDDVFGEECVPENRVD